MVNIPLDSFLLIPIPMAALPHPSNTRPLVLHLSPSLLLPILSRFSTAQLQGDDDDDDDEEEALISSVVSILQSQRSRTRWNFLKKSLVPPHRRLRDALTPSQLSSVTLRLKNSPRLALRFFQWTISNPSLCRHDLSSRATLIHVLARARLRSAALSLVRSAMASEDGENLLPEILGALAGSYRECDSAPLVFDLVVRACLAAKRIDRAVAVVRVLKSRGIFPENRTCCEVIRLVSKIRGCDEGFGVYQEVFGNDDGGGGRIGIGRGIGVWKPNVQVFNALMVASYRDGRLLEKAAEVFAEMENFGCEPNCFTYCVLMAGYCDEGMVERAVEIWEEMRSRGIKPDVVAYNTLIGGLCEIGNALRAEELFQEMVLEGNHLEPTCITYEHLVKGHCKNGDVNMAILVYNDLRRKGFQPGVMAVEILLDALCEKGRVAEGLRVFRNEMRREGFHPSRQCYKCLIKGFCADGKMEEAMRLQAEMFGKGFEADADVYDAVIAGYVKLDEVEKAGRLREEMSELGLLKVGDL